jgi:hypothetical protein
MTKHWEEGENEVTREAKRESARTGQDIEVILKRMLREAKQQKDTARRMKIIKAQKFVHRRNQRKRGKRK